MEALGGGPFTQNRQTSKCHRQPEASVIDVSLLQIIGETDNQQPELCIFEESEGDPNFDVGQTGLRMGLCIANSLYLNEASGSRPVG